MSTLSRLSVTLVTFALIFSYAIYKKNEIWKVSENSSESVLKTLPKFSVDKIGNLKDQNSVFSSEDFLNVSSEGLFVHFWATWCGPCEAELPAIIEMAEKFSEKKMTFLLIAINDEEIKIKKFFKRFSAFPKNIILAIDNKDMAFDKFGTAKVPETFLFSKEGILLNRYIGPQDWSFEGMASRVEEMLVSGVH